MECTNMKQIINDFKNLDLGNVSEKEVSDIFNRLTSLPVPITDYHKGKIIHRARIIKDNQTVKLNTELSYVPKKFNTSFQRASTPRQTMFYGAVVPQIQSDDEISNARIIGACEVSDFLRNSNCPDGKQKIVFGNWVVKETISLLSIIDPAIETNKINFFKEITENYHKFLEQGNEDKENTVLFQEYISAEFSKLDIKSQKDYLISALFTELVIDQCDGVIYPSVRADYNGLCVSIKPEAVDNKMELISVLECLVVKKEGKVNIINLRFGEVASGETQFELKKIKNI